MRFLAIVLCLVLVACPPITVGSAGFSSTIQLTANPEAVNADGKSVATVSAEVRDSSGDLVPDGTSVSFTTSLGTIESSAETVAGVARATLRSDTTVGTALVSATLTGGGAVAQLKVDFVPPGTALKGRSYISVSSRNYLVYCIDRRIIESIGGVKLLYRGASIEADSAQVDIDKMLMFARRRTGGEPIRIKHGGKTIEASLLRYDMTSGKGTIMTTSDAGVERQTFSIHTMQPEADESEEARPNDFDFADLSESLMFVKAKSITVREEQDIQFRKAEVYVDNKKILSIPLHVMPLTPGAGLTGQMLSVGNNGLRVDVPLYYSLSPSFAGSFRIRNQQAGGWGYYSSSPGWFLDLEQQYAAGLTGEGTLALTGITSGDWGARWTHNQDFVDGTRVYSYLDFPAHRDLYGMVNLTKPLDGYNLGLNLSGSRYQDQPATASGDVYLQTNAKPLIPSKVNYSLTARSSYVTGLAESDGLGTGLRLQLHGVPVRLGSRSSFSSSFAVGQDWGGRYSGQSLYGTASLSHQLGALGGLGLVYTYGKTPGVDSSNQRLSGNIFLNPGSRTRVNLFTTYGLDNSSVSSFGDINYRFNGGWSFSALSTYQKFRGIGYSDYEFAVGKQVAGQDLMLVWSKSQNRFRLEFGALKF